MTKNKIWTKFIDENKISRSIFICFDQIQHTLSLDYSRVLLVDNSLPFIINRSFHKT